MPNLRTSVETLASNFAGQLLEVIRGMSLEEILSVSKGGRAAPKASAGKASKAAAPKAAAPKAAAPKAAAPKAAAPAKSAPAAKSAPKKGGRLARRSVPEIIKEAERIAALLKSNPKGLTSEELQAKLGVSKEELASPMQRALSTKKIRKTGERRGTKYFAK